MATKTMIPSFVLGKVYFCHRTLNYFLASIILSLVEDDLVSKNIRFGIYICSPG